MSADLFAAFESSAEPSKQSQTQAAFQTASSNDPFSFLSSPISTPQAPNNQNPSQWPSFIQQQQAIIQPSWNSWTTPQAARPQNSGSWGDIAGFAGIEKPAEQTASVTQDDDAWGDFEEPTEFPQEPPVVLSSRVESPPTRTRITRASTIDLMTNKLVDLGISSTPEPWQERPSWEKSGGSKQSQGFVRQPAQESAQKPVQHSDPNVLFDADDFGDFETDTTAQPTAAVAPVNSALDLLVSVSPMPVSRVAQPKKQPPGLLLTNNTHPYPQAPKSPYGSFQNRKPKLVKQLQVKTPLTPEFSEDIEKESPSPVTAWPSVQKDGFNSEWEEFKDFTSTNQKSVPGKAKPPPTKALPASDWEWSAWDGSEGQEKHDAALPVTTSRDQASGPPPTNIPPPSILLSIFPQLLDTADTSLLKPIQNLTASAQKQRVLSDAATHAFLHGYLTLATVAARIIAGRKQRWHRDKFLMQGMAISAATSSKTRGMKLAGVDKAQAAREDREATEVVAVWKQQVGRLRSAVASANTAGAAGLKVPDLSTTMSAHAVQGVPTAPKVCVICGLKREERITKVDFQVEDSFGEWWVEFWGHRDCRNWWLEHEAKLRQR